MAESEFCSQICRVYMVYVVAVTLLEKIAPQSHVGTYWDQLYRKMGFWLCANFLNSVLSF